MQGRYIKVEGCILEEGRPLCLVELLVITFNHECRVLDLESRHEAILLPVLLLCIGLVRTLTFLGQILVEGGDKVALENS